MIELLNHLDITPVQRNKGIDGFLKVKDLFKPIIIFFLDLIITMQ